MKGALALAAAAWPLPSAAQDTLPSQARLEAALISDYRERGLSWSEGRAAARLYGELSVSPEASLSMQVGTTRGARRHGGAGAALALRASYAREVGLVRLEGSFIGHLFPGGRGAQDYVEAEMEAGTLLGPLDLALAVAHAPPQAAIGGGNLHGRARARVGLPGTRLTLVGQVGRSVGSGSDDPRSQRLRPDGAYTDWLLGGDYALGPVVVSLVYSDTDIGRGNALAHHGSRVVAGAHILF